MKRILAAACVLASLLGAAACARDAHDGDRPVIGISASTLENPFFVRFKNGTVEAARKAGADTLVTDAQNDALTQLNNVRDMITKGADVIVLNPVEPESATPAVEQANKHGIPVITVDRESSGGDVASHVASDNVEGGRLICDWLGRHLDGKGRLAILQGIPGTSPERDRDKGCKEALRAYPDIRVVARQPADWDREKGFTTTQNILQANPSVTAVFGRNDLAALGAAEAAVQAGRKNITVIGFDGIDDALNAIAKHRLSATIVQDPNRLGETAAHTAMRLDAGESVPKVQNLPVRVADADNIRKFTQH